MSFSCLIGLLASSRFAPKDGDTVAGWLEEGRSKNWGNERRRCPDDILSWLLTRALGSDF